MFESFSKYDVQETRKIARDEGHAQGLEQGHAQGHDELAIIAINNMLSDEMSIPTIAKILGLSVEKVQSLIAAADSAFTDKEIEVKTGFTSAQIAKLHAKGTESH
jgi:predicted transposase YdaD